MIKVAISGADTPVAGELIRILVNHPDVEIVSLIAQGHEGKQLQSIHHGLLGEVSLTFSGSFKPSSANILFIADPNVKASEIYRLRKAYPELKVVALNPPVNDIEQEDEKAETENEENTPELVFALPEINRKPLVRGAGSAVIPNPVSSLALVPLYPLALNMLLSGDITFNISAPEDIITEENLTRSIREIADSLTEAQRSFHGDIKFHVLPPTSKRGIELTVSIPCPLDMEHTLKAFDIYDDHNFSFAVTTPVKLDDVKGTEKIIFSLSLTKDGQLQIHSVADGRLRGSAGEAVHVMNLMFGLHEKTGLYLKPYAF
ncbi:MAG: hypothetical protein K2M69_01445 [Muribaculaceae bacterium]|nr:hypothetical protein [Muribaculaceae bacterium]